MRKIISMLLVLSMLVSLFCVTTASASGLTESGTVELYQLAPENQSLMESYVIKTKNGKLIVIDGGIDGAGINNAPYLPSALRAIAGVGEGEYFEVDAWFLSHAHVDHFYELSKMLNEYDEDSNYKINNIYFDFPNFGEEGVIWTQSELGKGYLNEFVTGLDNYAKVNDIDVKSGSYYKDLNAAVVNETAIKNGLDIVIDGVRFEIMQTWSDADGGTELNSTSVIIRMHAAGKSVLFLNDAYIPAGKRLLATYGDELKSDIVQTAHHGQSGVNEAVYKAIDADFFLWPTPKWVWFEEGRDYAINEVRQWANGGVDFTEKKENHLVACLYEAYPKDPTRVADWEGVIDGMKITLSFKDSDYEAPTPVNYLEYTGKAQALINSGSTTVGAMEYSLDGVSFSANIPTATNAGEYTVYYRIKSGDETLLTNTLTVTIAKAKTGVTPPKANGLAYTGEAQALVTAGSAMSGEMLYSLNGEDYTTTIPAATEKGTYTVYYKVLETANYAEVKGTVTASIGDYIVTFKNGNPLAPFDNEVAIAVNSGEKVPGVTYKAKANTALLYWKIGNVRYTTEEIFNLTVSGNMDVYAYSRETAITNCDYDFKTMTAEQFELTAFATDSDFILTEGVGIQLSKSASTTYIIPLATDVSERALSVSYGFTGTVDTKGFDSHFKSGDDSVAIFYHTVNYMRVYGDGAAQYIYNFGQLDDGKHHKAEFILDIKNAKKYVTMDGYAGIAPTDATHDITTAKMPEKFSVIQKAGGSLIIDSFSVKRMDDAKVRKVSLSAETGISEAKFLNIAQSSTYDNASIYMPEGTKVPVKATASMGYGFEQWQATTGSFDNTEAATAVYTAGTADATVKATGKLTDEWKDYVAKVGNAGYETLQAAINAAGDNDTIYLLKDISDNARIYFDTGKNITVNGNGYTYTDTGSNGDGATAMVVQSTTTVTFTNITLTQTNKNAWATSIPEANRRRVNGFFAINNSGKVIFGDNAVLDGAAGANGAVAWMNGGTSEFVLNGNGAAIRNVDTTYSHGIIAAYDGKAKITIKNGTIENCSSTGGSIIKARSGKSIEITGGKIINNTVSTGAVYAESDGTLTISGNPVIKNNKSGSTEKNVYLADNTYIRVNDNFTGEVGVTANHTQFAIAGKAGLTGLEGFFHDGTTYKGRYYVAGTKFVNETAQEEIEARNAGRELAVIFDYPFSYAAAGADFLKAGVPAGNLTDASQNVMIVYLLRDIKITDVADKGATAGYDNYHINLSGANNFTYDGNGFVFKITDGNYQKKYHVFRIYDGTSVTFKNFIYDGNDLMSFVNADCVTIGGSLTLENCIIKNCLHREAGGAIRGSDGKIVIKNSVLDGSDSEKNGGTIYLVTPQTAEGKSELIVENSVIKNSTGAKGGGICLASGTSATITESEIIGCSGEKGGGIRIEAGATATVTDSTIKECSGSNGGGIGADGTLVMTDSTVYGCYSSANSTNGGGIMVWSQNAKATLTNVIVDSCTAPSNGGICLVTGTLELLGNTEIKNCRSNATRTGLSLVGTAGTAIIGENTKIVNNKTNAGALANIHNEGTIILAADFTGNVGFTTLGTVKAAAGLTSFEKINSVFLDKDATKYPNIADDKSITWELIPTIAIETDAAWLYKDGAHTEYASDKSGLVRFVTTFSNTPSAGLITNYGTYLVSAETNELGGITTVATFNENTDKIATESFYVVDAVGITNGETKTIYGLSYVTLKNIDTPIYFNYAIHTIDDEAKKITVEA